jgi:hypothetical protein
MQVLNMIKAPGAHKDTPDPERSPR